MHTVDVDVLVIGGGGAGAQAALAAASKGASVALVEKGIFGRSGCTVMGAYSCCAAFGHADPRDNPEVHFEDTIRAGRYINDPALVEVFVREAPRRVLELYQAGVPFARAGHGFCQGMLDGHTYPRACFIDYFHTGRGLLLGMRRLVLRDSHIAVYSDMLVLELVCRDRRVWGALAYDVARAHLVLFRSKATVIATGGGARVYAYSTVSADNTGDGLALALAAGAALADMEFIQFYPTVTLYPRLVGFDPTAPATLRLQAQARIYNARGEDFIDRLLPDWRFKGTRDFMARTIYSEIVWGGATSPHGGVYIDVSHLPGEVVESELGVDNFYQKLLSQGVDLKKGPIEITVAAHYFMGGIRINPDGWTGVEGLYAAGEAAAGFHGANRLAGNALSEILVSGHRAGLAAATQSSRVQAVPPASDLVRAPRERFRALVAAQRGPTGPEVKTALQRIMWEKVGVVRNATSLTRARQELDQVATLMVDGMSVGPGVPYHRQLVEAVEARHMISVCRAIILSALTRRESRGAHYRSDFPAEDPTWQVNVEVRQARPGEEPGGELEVTLRPTSTAASAQRVTGV